MSSSSSSSSSSNPHLKDVVVLSFEVSTDSKQILWGMKNTFFAGTAAINFVVNIQMLVDGVDLNCPRSRFDDKDVVLDLLNTSLPSNC